MIGIDMGARLLAVALGASLWGCGSSHPGTAAPWAVSFGQTIVLSQVLSTGEMLGAPTPVSPSTNNVSFVWLSVHDPTSYMTLQARPGDLGTSAGAIARVGGQLVTVGSSVVSDPRDPRTDQQPRREVPVLWSTPTAAPTPLAMGSATTGRATGVSSQGHIVGLLDDALVLWTNPDTVSKIATVGTSGSFRIADAGQIAMLFQMSASVWESATAAPISLGLSGQFGLALSLGADGLLVGFDQDAGTATPGAADFAVYWSPTDHYVKHRLAAPPMARSFRAQVVDKHGVIAGSVTYQDSTTGGVVWPTPGAAVELRALVAASPGYVVSNAIGLLDDGTIVCLGTVDKKRSIIFVKP